jgi:hypothetical protein
VADEQAKLRTGRVSGYALTAAGRAAHASLLDEQVTEAERAGLGVAYEAFLPLNDRFKNVCTRWQTRPGPDGAHETNDHTDPDYDAGVIDELVAVHKDITDGLTPAVEDSPRFGRYPDRFTAALDRVRGGDPAAFTRPMTGSYHDVWMELHQDMLLTLGRERGAADGH